MSLHLRRRDTPGVLTNHRFTLAARPVGLPKATDFSYTEEAVPGRADVQLVVKVRDVSLAPGMRGWMNGARSYIAPVKLGEVMRAFALGAVVTSQHAGFAPGDLVAGLFGTQE